MRHVSVRVQGKNYRNLGGAPLFHHILRTLSSCPSISKIVIDTDSPVVRESTQKHFPAVQLLERPDHLLGDAVPMTEILFHDASLVPAETYFQTHSTNPFLRAETIEGAIRFWQGARNQHDSVFSVTRIQARLWDSQTRPLNHDPNVLLRTQDLDPIYLENSGFYIFPAELILSSRRRIGDRPRLYEIDPIESIDIDDEKTFALAEQMIGAGK